MKKGFYDGQRFHRAVPGFVVQFGDPQIARHAAAQAWWGAARRSGTPIGVAEITKKRLHVPGAVAMAHPGTDRTTADSQIYVTLARRAGARRQVRRLRPGRHGRWTSSAKIQRGDVIKTSLREGVTAAGSSRGPSDRDSARRTPRGYSPSIGSPSCCLIIAALATDFAEK